MRYYQIITETSATVDFDAATCERYEDQFYFRFPVTGGRGFGKIKVAARVDSDHIVYIENIIVSNLSDHPDATTPKSFQHAVRLGNSTTRKMLHFIVDRLKAVYPNIDQIAGERVTGARAGRLDNVASVNLHHHSLAR